MSEKESSCPEWEDVEKKDYRGIWVLGDIHGGRISEASLQMLTPAKELATKLDVDVTGVILGSKISKVAREMFYHGADRSILVDEPSLGTYFPEIYASVMAQLAKRFKPELILIAGTMRCREMAPCIANILRVGITADCTGFDVDSESRDVLQIRPPFGAIMLASIRTPFRRPQIATARPNVFPLPKRDEGKMGKIIRAEVDVPKPRGRLVNSQSLGLGRVLLEKADCIVSAGKGIGGPEGIGLLEELASQLGGVVAGSRKAVDAGWLPADRQIGQTGKTVKPILYIAVGISGSAQHVFGIREAKSVMAINTDSEAPIFKYADYGVVGDYRDIVPALIEEIKRTKLSRPNQLAGMEGMTQRK
ncbi:MAG TPA: electron transfer flavoprotein subunit alpha/FixB family protein [Candidatus Bathyarchaeia archaeon]|nr:MAG: electron transfer flavoprotein subunit alpha [Candidatus Bathyarchaeota archaeon RBG_16_48_13]HJX23638.1 electron transfer flavoprotein subunit alpha/FixB family protein [Candidatus Bathyarchaeia archaeon]